MAEAEVKQLTVKFTDIAVKYDEHDAPIFGAQAGEVVTLPEDQAQRWIRRGKAELYDGSAAAGEVLDLTQPATLDEIIEVIGGLDTANPDLWTAQGVPTVQALESALGNRKVEAKQRDLAWVKFKKAR